MAVRSFLNSSTMSYPLQSRSGKIGSFRYRGDNSSNFATSASQIVQDFPQAPDGLYWMNIGDGRGVVQYYVNTTFANGPWVLVANAMNSVTGDPATTGIFNNGTPSSTTPYSTTVLNTNFAGNGGNFVPYRGILGANANNTYSYFLIGTQARSIINAEFLDTAGETSTTAAAQSYFTATKVGASINGGPHVDTYSTASVIELHHGGWSASSGINFIMMNQGSGKSAGGGYDNAYVGWGNSNTVGNSNTAATQNNLAIYIKV